MAVPYTKTQLMVQSHNGNELRADMAKLANAIDLRSITERFKGSSPFIRTVIKIKDTHFINLPLPTERKVKNVPRVKVNNSN